MGLNFAVARFAISHDLLENKNMSVLIKRAISSTATTNTASPPPTDTMYKINVHVSLVPASLLTY